MTADARDILIVEDDREIRQAMADLLQDEGLSVSCAPGGEEALAMLGGGLGPRVILMDLRMPGMGGQEAITAIRMNPDLAQPAIVVVTAEAVDLSALPVSGVLRKPVAASALLRLVWPLARGVGYPGN